MQSAPCSRPIPYLSGLEPNWMVFQHHLNCHICLSKKEPSGTVTTPAPVAVMVRAGHGSCSLSCLLLNCACWCAGRWLRTSHPGVMSSATDLSWELGDCPAAATKTHACFYNADPTILPPDGLGVCSPIY